MEFHHKLSVFVLLSPSLRCTGIIRHCLLAICIISYQCLSSCPTSSQVFTRKHVICKESFCTTQLLASFEDILRVWDWTKQTIAARFWWGKCLTLTLGWAQKGKCMIYSAYSVSKEVFLLARWMPAVPGKQHLWMNGRCFGQCILWFDASGFRCNECEDSSADRCFSLTFLRMNSDQMSGNRVIEFTHPLSTGLEAAWV